MKSLYRLFLYSIVLGVVFMFYGQQAPKAVTQVLPKVVGKVFQGAGPSPGMVRDMGDLGVSWSMIQNLEHQVSVSEELKTIWGSNFVGVQQQVESILARLPGWLKNNASPPEGKAPRKATAP